MAFATIELDARGAKDSIELNRPEKLNPLSTETLRELAEAAHLLGGRPEVRVVVVRGRGRAFSADATCRRLPAPRPAPPSSARRPTLDG